MAFVSQLNQIPCRTLSLTPPHPRLTSKPSILAPNPLGLATPKLKFSNPEFSWARPATRIRALDQDDSRPEKPEEEEEPSDVAVAVAEREEEKPAEPEEISKLKKALVGSFYGTDRGLSATSETRAEIVELITQLEAQNPTPAPTEALPLLNGKWILS